MSIVLPGQCIVETAADVNAGPGTYLRDGSIYASIIGAIVKTDTTVSVRGRDDARSAAVPDSGSIVVGTIQKINKLQATMAIQTVDGIVSHDFQGVIRVQDVRQTEKDKVRVFNSFRPGDVVRAQVLSLGDARSYYLSTASNQLGVINATSESGNLLKASTWESMQDPITGKVESRKVAGPESAST